MLQSLKQEKLFKVSFFNFSRKTKFVFLNFIMILLVLLSFIGTHCWADTLWISNPKWLSSANYNFYKLILKHGKTKYTRSYIGFDSKLLKSEMRIKNSTEAMISFFWKDSLVYSLSLHSDTNFVALVSLVKLPKLGDTIRISENPKTKKIDFSQAYFGFKYLKPVNITISNNTSLNPNEKFEETVFVFNKNKLITFFKSSYIIIKEEQGNKKK